MDWNNLTNEHFLWASMFWGAIAGGYYIYGWRQKAAIPLAVGAVMTFASFMLPALWMSVVCIVSILAAWWLSRQGY